MTGIGSGVLYRSSLWQLYQLWHGGLARQLQKLAGDTLPHNTNTLLEPIIRVEPGLAFAVDTAIWDLKGKQQKQPVASLLGGAQQTAVPITEQLFINNWGDSQQELHQIAARGTTRLKIKTGFSPQADIALLQKVRRVIGNNVQIRIDANRAYSLAESVDLYRKMKEMGVTALEEPINDPHWAALRRLREMVKLPVMLDESILSPADLQQAIQAGALDSLNIKLTRAGGMTQALAYQRMCREASIAVSIGCNEDIGPGMAAILHFSAAQEKHDGTEGMGHLRLGTDIIQESMPITNGHAVLPSGPGLGVTLKPDFPQALPRQIRTFDLNQAGPAMIRSASWVMRNRQRAATAVYRLQRVIL